MFFYSSPQDRVMFFFPLGNNVSVLLEMTGFTAPEAQAFWKEGPNSRTGLLMVVWLILSSLPKSQRETLSTLLSASSISCWYQVNINKRKKKAWRSMGLPSVCSTLWSHGSHTITGWSTWKEISSSSLLCHTWDCPCSHLSLERTLLLGVQVAQFSGNVAFWLAQEKWVHSFSHC